MLNSVSFLELVDSAACIYEFLSAGEEGMAFAANIHFQRISFLGRAGLERRPARTGHRDLVIIGMNIGFHDFHLSVLTFFHQDADLLYIIFAFKSNQIAPLSEKNSLFPKTAGLAPLPPPAADAKGGGGSKKLPFPAAAERETKFAPPFRLQISPSWSIMDVEYGSLSPCRGIAAGFKGVL